MRARDASANPHRMQQQFLAGSQQCGCAADRWRVGVMGRVLTLASTTSEAVAKLQRLSPA
jgi:hypothetical protein